jgi:hypothetical protein
VPLSDAFKKKFPEQCPCDSPKGPNGEAGAKGDNGAPGKPDKQITANIIHPILQAKPDHKAQPATREVPDRQETRDQPEAMESQVTRVPPVAKARLSTVRPDLTDRRARLDQKEDLVQTVSKFNMGLINTHTSA